jgi:hypothetical protein
MPSEQPFDFGPQQQSGLFHFKVLLWERDGSAVKPDPGIVNIQSCCENCARQYIVRQILQSGHFVKSIERTEELE